MTDSDSSSENEFHGENSEDLSFSELVTFPDFLNERGCDLMSLQLDHNQISVLPRSIKLFTNLVTLNISNNTLTFISDEIVLLQNLKTLNLKNNNIRTTSIPKDFGNLLNLEVLNLSGNDLTDFPQQITELSKLKYLYLGGNQLTELPSNVQQLQRLEYLYLGGNLLTDIPAEVGHLHMLMSLVLCHNRLQSLPPTLINLRRLQSLSLHNNQLATLPPEIVSLNLIELSLRNNPLVVKFVQDLTYDPPSLLEMAGRVIKIEKIKYKRYDLPPNLNRYLKSAQRCVNPRCKGVYFSARVEHVKFVDFCGKYRLPLLQYLCSPTCSTSQPTVSCNSDTEEEEDSALEKMRRVLLG